MLLDVGILVRDVQRSVAFYTEHFGGRVVEDAVVDGAPGLYAPVGRSAQLHIVIMAFPEGGMIELVKPLDAGESVATDRDEVVRVGLHSMTFLVPSLEAKLRELAVGGVLAVTETVEVSLPKLGSSRVTFVRDPDGCLIELAESTTDGSFPRQVSPPRRRTSETVTGVAATDAAVPSPGTMTLDEEDRRRVLVEWNATVTDVPADCCIHELFEAQVERTPDAVAVVLEAEQLTYSKLNERSNRLAHWLRRHGVGTGALVGICAERSAELVVAMLATLKAGAAYVPVDPSYPPGRIAFMLEDAAAPVLLTRHRLAERLPAHEGRTLCLDSDWYDVAGAAASNPERTARARDLAYVMYTSGSTGAPKGVMIEHRSLCNFWFWMHRWLPLGADDAVLQVMSFSFDGSVWDFYGPLLSGARLVLPRPGVNLDSDALVTAIRTNRVTHLKVVPSLLRILVDHPELHTCTSLRHVMCGGEALPTDLADRLVDRLDVSIHNLYGPTEATVDAASWTYERGSDCGTMPLGRPVDNGRVFLLDQHLDPVPVGVPGELYVGGAGLARGYLHRPALTAERFIPDHLGEEPGARLYRTGDRARYRPDGRLEFLGRVDRQVKILGFRIELGEVEAVLRAHPDVAECVVSVRDDDAGSGRLVAYFVDAGFASPSEDELRAVLHESLPDYMVPTVIVRLDSFPLTANGKIDHAALPSPPDRLDSRPYMAPRDDLERALVRSWQGVLGVERIGVLDSFFDVGGDSIRGAILLMELQQKLGDVVYITALFDAPTIADFANYLRTHYAESVPRLCAAGTKGNRNEAVASVASSRVDTEAIDRLRQIIGTRETILEAPAAKARTAVFVLSPPRSGSTLFRVMLAGHPEFFAPPEFELMPFATLSEREVACVGRHAYALEGTVRAVMELHRCDADRARQIMDECTASSLTVIEFYRRLQGWLGPRMLVEKSTSYGQDVAVLRRIEAAFEDPLYIHLVRHPCAMIHSYVEARIDRAFRHRHPFGARQLGELMWVVQHQNILAALREVPAGRYHRVHFEALLEDPEATLGHVCRFMGVELHDEMLEPYHDREKRMTDGLLAVSRSFGDPEFHKHDQIDPRVAHRWIGHVDPESLNAVTRKLARDLGYALASGSANAPNALAVEAVDELSDQQMSPAGRLETLTAEQCRTLQKRRRAAATGGRTTWPVSHAQQRLVFMDQLGAGGNYNAARSWLLVGPLELDALARSLAEIARRHEALRTCFVIDEDGQATQRVDADQTLSLERVDLGHLHEADRGAETRRLLAETAARPFDLTHGPVGRACLVRWSDTDHVLLLAFHHIACDGWSFGLLLRDLDDLYEAFVRNELAPLAPLAVPYGAHAEWERDALTGEERDRSLAYWKERLAGAPELDPPVDRRPTSRSTPRGDRVDMRLTAAATVGLRTLAREQRATLYMALLAAVDVLLARHCGQDDVVLGTPIANRRREETRDHIGFFVNMLAMRVDVSGNPSYRDLLSRVREVALGAYRHQDVPFERIVEELGLRHQLGRNPLFNVAFALQNASERELSLAGIEATPFATGFVPAQFDLSIHARERGDEILFEFRYDTTLFHAATIERMARHLRLVIEGVVARPDAPVQELSLLTASERHRLVEEWNDTDTAYPRDASIAELFEEQVALRPDAVAVVFGEKTLTYAQLNERANQVAHTLRDMGVGVEDLVGLCVERSPEMVVGLLGILKAGGAYLPLDPTCPAQRLACMLEDSGVSVLLTQEPLLQSLPDRRLEVLCLDRDASAICRAGSTNPSPLATGGNLAYVIYTSGSTGRPKGVAVAHRNLVAMLHAYEHMAPSGERLLGTAVCPFSFDVSVWEVFSVLCFGGELHLLLPSTFADPQTFTAYLIRHGVTSTYVPPALLSAMGERLETIDGPIALDRMLVGVEPIKERVLQRFRNASQRIRVINGYGSTETTVCATFFDFRAEEDAERMVPIGRALANTRAYIVDNQLQLAPIGVPGELYTGGDGVARGYLNDAALTAQRFIPDPFSREPAARLYRTGDQARYRPDGTIEFLGRRDDQVKIRGFRIEPGEIEAVLGEHDGVREAVVAVHQDQTGDKQLAAYLVPQPERDGLVDDVRRSLRARLPAYMVPATFTLLDTLPLSPNGKVDRRALTAPATTPSEQREFVAPRSGEEEVVASIWAETLGIDRISARDDFFDLGGHSLKATQVITRIRSRLGVELPLESLFDSPTVAGIAEHLRTLRWARESASEHAGLVDREEIEL